MAAYRIDLYAEPHRLTGVQVVTAPAGTDATETALRAVWTTGADFAEVFAHQVGDDAYYTTVTRAAR